MDADCLLKKENNWGQSKIDFQIVENKKAMFHNMAFFMGFKMCECLHKAWAGKAKRLSTKFVKQCNTGIFFVGRHLGLFQPTLKLLSAL